MPIYEYQCRKCNKISEFLEDAVESPKGQKCRFCASADLKKILSSFATMSSNPSSPCDSCSTSDEMPSCAAKGFCAK